MHIAALALTTLALAPAPQEAEGLRMVDCVEVIVNDEILTYRQVMGAAARRIPEGVSPTQMQLAELRNQVGRDLINERLQVQGGIDMGFEEQAVERIVDSSTERRIGTAGGVIQMADQLGETNSSLNDQKTALRRDLYRFSWERAITGVSAGVSGRPFRDRYVRPGKLRLHFEQLKAGRMGAEAIGGQSARYQLQEITLPIPSEAEAEEVRVRAEEIYKELSNGLEFTAAVQALPNPPENDGVLPPLTGADLARNGGAEVAAFALSAAPGDISRPMPILVSRRRLVGWRIMKLIEADAPLLPLFEAPKTQASLRRAIQRETDDYRRNAGIKALTQGAYVWLAAEAQQG